MTRFNFRPHRTAGIPALLLVLFLAGCLPTASAQTQEPAGKAVTEVAVTVGHSAVQAELPAATSVAREPESSVHGAEQAIHPGMFDFDLTILVSQTLNFLLLLYILQRFLFIPIGNIIEERRRNLGRIQNEIEAERQKAGVLKLEYEKQIENVQQELYQIRQKAILLANERVEEIIQEARKKAEEIIEHGEMEIFMERQSAWARIREDVVQLTLMAAEKVVEESLDDDHHRRMIARTIERLENDLPDHGTH